MDRRAFLASSVTASALAGGAVDGSLRAKEVEPGAREYYELRHYQLLPGRQHDNLNEFLQKAWLPAVNRTGVAPVGVFDVVASPDSPAMYTLIPHQSLERLTTLDARLALDPAFQANGGWLINALPSDPAYVRVENSLMVAFEGLPRIQAPNFGEHQPHRIFELRTYESHSRKANRKKIEMFNRAEIAIFRRTGLQPVFFGETLIGQRLPQLTYMLTFDGMESHDQNWARFIADPEWKKLSKTPGYTDAEIVSKISKVFLRPTSYSQI